jgi:hypothetical protein
MGDLWWLFSDGDVEFMFVFIRFVCCCNIGVGLICVIIPVLSTIPEIELATELLLFSFDNTAAICDCCCVLEHFISMGTDAGVMKIQKKW